MGSCIFLITFTTCTSNPTLYISGVTHNNVGTTSTTLYMHYVKKGCYTLRITVINMCIHCITLLMETLYAILRIVPSYAVLYGIV